jgi:hypothetical protein
LLTEATVISETAAGYDSDRNLSPKVIHRRFVCLIQISQLSVAFGVSLHIPLFGA